MESYLKSSDIRAGMKLIGMQDHRGHLTKGKVYEVSKVKSFDTDGVDFFPVSCDSGDSCTISCTRSGWRYQNSDGHEWFKFIAEEVTLTPEEEAKAVMLDRSKLSDLDMFLK